MSNKKISFQKKISIQTAENKNNYNPSKFFVTSRLTASQYLSKIRLTIPPEFYNKAISDIEKNPISNSYLLGTKSIKKLNQLDSQELAFIDFDSEFYWAKNNIVRNQKIINKFLELSKEYSAKLCGSNLLEAGAVLDKIENEFGYSVWLIKNKVAFLQLSSGLESQKEYSNGIKSSLSNGGLVKFIIHWTSVRNEPQITSSKFIGQVEPIINRINPLVSPGYKEYCKYHLLAVEYLEPADIIQVLRLEHSRSLIDYYEAFLSLLRLMTLDKSPVMKAKVLSFFTSSDCKIEDTRIIPLLELLDIKGHSLWVDNYLIEPFNFIFDGEFSQFEASCPDYLDKFPDNPLLIMAKSIANSTLYNDDKFNWTEDDLGKSSNEPYFNRRIIYLLSQVLKRGTLKASKEHTELSKIYLNFSPFSWTSIIKLILLQEDSIFPKVDSACEVLALKASSVHPALINWFQNGPNGEKYESICFQKFSKELATEFYLSIRRKAIMLDPHKLFPDFKNLLMGLLAFDNSNFTEAVKYGDLLKASNEEYFRRRGYGLVSHAQVKMLELKNACTTIADCYVSDRNYFSFLPLQEIFKIITSGSPEWRSVNNLVDFPIVLDAYTKHVNKKLETERRFAYEDFLNKNGIEKPSELLPIIGKFDIKKIIYYLRFICIETVMDTSSAFAGGSFEVVEERLLICRLLINLDPVNSEVYKQEVNDLVRRQVIASRRQEVDQSRIFVDIPSIKEWAESELKESFDRYITYRKIESNKGDRNEDKAPTKIESYTITDINVPENEAKALLKFLLEEVTDAYLSPEFGLDRFLSTRIRHGILEGHLRKPVQNQNLITKKEFRHGPYLGNDFWLSKLKTNGSSSIKQFDKAFSRFSESYDKLIQMITNEWLQVKRESHEKGLFNFVISDNDVNEFAFTINEETTFNQFIELVIRMLDGTLINNLINIRDTLNNTAKAQAKNLLNELQSSTFSNKNPALVELNGAINQARTDLQSQFDKIIEWFVPPSSGSSTPYVIEDAIRVAEAIIKETSPAFKIDVKADEESAIAIHGNLPIFVDIFVNIFDNVVKRSRLDYPEALVKIWTEKLLPNLTVVNFKITNDLGFDVDVVTLKKELKNKITILNDGTYSKHLAKDRNSGLFKIFKSIRDCKAPGFDVNPTMDFGIDNNIFYINIAIPFRIHVMELEHQ